MRGCRQSWRRGQRRQDAEHWRGWRLSDYGRRPTGGGRCGGPGLQNRSRPTGRARRRGLLLFQVSGSRPRSRSSWRHEVDPRSGVRDASPRTGRLIGQALRAARSATRGPRPPRRSSQTYRAHAAPPRRRRSRASRSAGAAGLAMYGPAHDTENRSLAGRVRAASPLPEMRSFCGASRFACRGDVRRRPADANSACAGKVARRREPARRARSRHRPRRRRRYEGSPVRDLDDGDRIAASRYRGRYLPRAADGRLARRLRRPCGARQERPNASSGRTEGGRRRARQVARAPRARPGATRRRALRRSSSGRRWRARRRPSVRSVDRSSRDGGGAARWRGGARRASRGVPAPFDGRADDPGGVVAGCAERELVRPEQLQLLPEPAGVEAPADVGEALEVVGVRGSEDREVGRRAVRGLR